MADNQFLAELLRSNGQARNRAGQPVDAYSTDMFTGAMQGLGNILGGAARGSLTSTLGLGGDINQAIVDNLGTAINAPGLPTTKDIQEMLPYQPTTHEGQVAQKLGEFAPISPKVLGKMVRATKDMPIGNMIAYHGTPHEIQGAFDISKVGTGEGAQSYGHGMYYAENPKVAEEYQKMLAGPEQTAAEYLKLYKTPESAISALEYGITPNLTAEAKKFSEDAINVLKSGKELKGNLYKVDIPDKDIPNMLDWDKPLSQQPKSVQNALAKYDPDLYSPKSNDYDSNELGQMIYNRIAGLENVRTPSPTDANVKATNKLNELGITGIRYLDEGSRSKGGTSNFVVFDPKEVKILEKNGQPTRKEVIEQAFEGAMPHYKDYENLSSVFEKAGLKIKETGSSKSNSKYVEIKDPVSGEVITARFANHPQSGNAMTLHGPADIEIGDIFKHKSWEDAINPILDRINKSRKEFGDELLTLNNKSRK